jgi:hypothetical protein
MQVNVVSSCGDSFSASSTECKDELSRTSVDALPDESGLSALSSADLVVKASASIFADISKEELEIVSESM